MLPSQIVIHRPLWNDEDPFTKIEDNNPTIPNMQNLGAIIQNTLAQVKTIKIA